MGLDYDVRNFGKSGRTMLNRGDQPYMKETVWKEALDFKPDIAIVKLGTNDTKPENWQYGADYEHDMQQLIDALRTSNPAVTIYLCTPIPAFKATWNISDSVLVNAIIPSIRLLAERNHCKVIDLHTLYAPYGQLMLKDGIHPNEAGASKLAELVRGCLLQD